MVILLATHFVVLYTINKLIRRSSFVRHVSQLYTFTAFNIRKMFKHRISERHFSEFRTLLSGRAHPNFFGGSYLHLHWRLDLMIRNGDMLDDDGSLLNDRRGLNDGESLNLNNDQRLETIGGLNLDD